MSADDDEALTWDGTSDPSHVESPAEKAAAAEKPAADKPAADKPAPLAKEGLSSVLLITYGILGGMYLLYTVGWLLSVFNDNRTAFADPLTEVMYQTGEYLAIGAPALWFITALVLSRGRKPIVRLLAIVAGLLVVIPWPFVLLGA